MLGEHYFRNNDAKKAAAYFAIGAQPGVLPSSKLETRAQCMAYLSILELSRNVPGEALKKAQTSLELFATDEGRIAFAKASLAITKSLAPGSPERQAQLDAAQAKLGDIKSQSPFKSEADKLLAEIRKR